jgi:hypothetical protein
MRTKEDPGTAGDAGEENWAELMRSWLPATLYVVTKGRIIFSSGETSPQVDVLVLSASYPKGLLNKKLYLAAGVIAAFECKITLRPIYIREAIQASVTIGSLVRQDNSVRHHIYYGLLAHSYRITAKRKRPEDVIGDALIRHDRDIVRDPRDCLDFICVANLGTWAVFKGGIPHPDKGNPVLITAYMGPFDEAARQLQNPEVNFDPDPIGRFLTGLLERFGKRDTEIAAIAEYFRDVELFGIAQGRFRYWEPTELPDQIDDSFG